jgi:AraC-like DNA-binding protein
MIGGDKNMIASCIEKMMRGACGGCEREEACAAMMRRFGVRPERAGTPYKSGAAALRRTEGLGSFMALLGEVSKAFERRPAAPAPTPFRGDVERQIEMLLPQGGLRIDSVASALGLSRQTLYRRLKAEGTTFEALVERVRRRLALRFIRDEGLTVKEAAWRLGFAEPSAFSRAFKRWTGRSPAEMRRGRPGQSG